MEDLVLLVATAGLILYHLFTIAGVSTIADEEQRNEALAIRYNETHTVFHCKSTIADTGLLSITVSCILTVEVLLQTTLIIFASNMPNDIDEERLRMLKKLCTYLAVGNLFEWFDSSLTLGSVKHTDPIKEIVYSKKTWTVLSRCIFPMMLFYRFHSGHLLWHVNHVEASEEDAPR